MDFRKLYTLLFIFISISFYAQGERIREKKEQIKAMKVAFLTTELNLTSNEAEKFWPIYNTFDDKQFELRHQKMKGAFRKMDDNDLNQLSEKEANALLTQIENNEEELFNLRKKFISSLREVLPSVKIIKLKKQKKILIENYYNNTETKALKGNVILIPKNPIL